MESNIYVLAKFAFAKQIIFPFFSPEKMVGNFGLTFVYIGGKGGLGSSTVCQTLISLIHWSILLLSVVILKCLNIFSKKLSIRNFLINLGPTIT